MPESTGGWRLFDQVGTTCGKCHQGRLEESWYNEDRYATFDSKVARCRKCFSCVLRYRRIELTPEERKRTIEGKGRDTAPAGPLVVNSSGSKIEVTRDYTPASLISEDEDAELAEYNSWWVGHGFVNGFDRDREDLGLGCHAKKPPAPTQERIRKDDYTFSVPEFHMIEHL